jgi:HSP20 family protein
MRECTFYPYFGGIFMSLIHFQPARTANWAAQIQRGLLNGGLLNDWERAFGFNALANDADEAAWVPAVDIRETDKAFVINADLPGVAAQDVEITSDKGVLTIRGTRANDASEPNAYSRVERAYGKFARRFTLPETANVDAIAAKSANGVLTVTIPKQEAVQPRRIEIAAA